MSSYSCCVSFTRDPAPAGKRCGRQASEHLARMTIALLARDVDRQAPRRLARSTPLRWTSFSPSALRHGQVDETCVASPLRQRSGEARREDARHSKGLRADRGRTESSGSMTTRRATPAANHRVNSTERRAPPPRGRAIGSTFSPEESARCQMRSKLADVASVLPRASHLQPRIRR